MGTSKRYAAHFERLGDMRHIERTAAGREPETLTPREINRANEDFTVAARAHPCRAWVRYGQDAIHVEAEVCAWTQRAVAIRWRISEDEYHKAWVWASAVSDPLP